MVLLFREGGGLRTEDGLSDAASGVFCNSCPAFRNIPGFLFFPDSGVLNSSTSVRAGEGESIFISLEEQRSSSLSFDPDWASSVNSFLHSMLGCAVTLFRIEVGDLFLIKLPFLIFHTRA